MNDAYLIGIDFGSELARGVLIEAESAQQVAYHVHRYRHGIMTEALPAGKPLLDAGFALQNAADYLEAAEVILKTIAEGREVLGIGIDFTASSPLPALADGRAFSEVAPDDPHAYVKLWKHASAQRYAEAINSAGGSYLGNFGGKVSGEWMLAKAAQIAAEAPEVWSSSDRFIEAGDWLVWRLTGREARSLDFAAFKAQYTADGGYPKDVVEGLAAKLTEPTTGWIACRTAFRGMAAAHGDTGRGGRRRGGDRFACRAGRRRRVSPWHTCRRARNVGCLPAPRRRRTVGCRPELRAALTAPRCPASGATKRDRQRSGTCSPGSSGHFRGRATSRRTSPSTIATPPRWRPDKAGSSQSIGGTATGSRTPTRVCAALLPDSTCQQLLSTSIGRSWTAFASARGPSSIAFVMGESPSSGLC